jgi:hypothetical protein
MKVVGTIFHNKIESEIFNEEDAIVFESLSHECVEKRVSSTISSCSTSSGLTSYTQPHSHLSSDHYFHIEKKGDKQRKQRIKKEEREKERKGVLTFAKI